MKKNEIYVLGSINADLVIYTDRIPEKGETIAGSDFTINAGGKGANQASAASLLGSKVNMIGAVGNDYNQSIVLDSLKVSNVNINSVKVLEEVSTGTAVIIRTKDDNRIILDGGANYLVSKEDVDKHLLGSKGDIFISQYEIPIDVVKYGLVKAKELEMITILNPAPVEVVSDELYKYIDYLVINQSEGKLLTGIYPKTVEDCEEIYNFFKPKGIKTLVVTLGEIGSVIINDEVIFRKSHKITPVDTTGAGDAFIGAFAYGLINDFTNSEKLEFSNATSALVCLKEGAQKSMPNLNEVKEYIMKENLK